MKEEKNAAPLSRLELERYVAGEASAEENAAVEARMAGDPALAQRVAEMKAQDAAFAGKFPAERIVREIQAAASGKAAPRVWKAEPQAKPLLDRMGLGSLAFPAMPRFALAMALLVLCAIPVLLMRQETGVIGERVKGKEAALLIYRKAAAGPEKLADGASAKAGDVLQAEFRPGRFAYGAVFSVDGNGAVTLHWPDRAEAPTALSALPERRLPEAFQLDDSPRFERFYMVLSAAPVDVAAWLKRAAESSDRPAAWLAGQGTDSVRILTLTLKKGL